MRSAPEPPAASPVTPAQRRVVFAFVGATTLGTFAASLIWGVSTLFQMQAGLDIFEVMVAGVGAALAPIVFEVPTGVLADTVGRRASYLASLAILAFSTLLFLAAGRYGWGLPGFFAAGALLSLGWTFQTGAVDAWLVDALDHTGWKGPKDRVFGWGGVAAEASLLVGAVAGGFLGQIDLALPFVVRAAVLIAAFAFVAATVRDLGFQRRSVSLDGVGHEMSRIFRDGVRHGWRHPVIRPMLFEGFFAGAFFVYCFYSLQPYLLDLLGKQLIWVAAVGTAVGSAAGMLGSGLADRVMRGSSGRRRAPRVLAVVSASASVAVLGAGVIGLVTRPQDRGWLPVLALTVMWMAMSFANGLVGPIRRSLLNRHIPSSHRATVLSFDAMFAEAGAAAGQPGLGWMSRAWSIPVAWIGGAVLLFASVPALLAADRAAGPEDTRPG